MPKRIKARTNRQIQDKVFQTILQELELILSLSPVQLNNQQVETLKQACLQILDNQLKLAEVEA